MKAYTKIDLFRYARAGSDSPLHNFVYICTIFAQYCEYHKHLQKCYSLARSLPYPGPSMSVSQPRNYSSLQVERCAIVQLQLYHYVLYYV